MDLKHGEKKKNNFLKKVTLINTITSIILQLVSIISGFIIPRLILSFFGSDVNGLVASLTKFLSYIALLEGGVTGVITASLYKPLQENNEEKISAILKTTDKFYKKIGFIFILYSIVLSIVYPILFNTGFSFLYVFCLCLIIAIGFFIQYNFSLTLKTLLTADKKVYIVAISQTFITLLNIILVIISVKIYPNVHLLKFISSILFVLQPIIYKQYVKKHYKINKDIKYDKTLLKSRWDGLAINVAGFIHTNTDILILTIFTSMSTVSIYSVYALVASGIRTIISSISSGIKPTIGQAYAKGNIEILNKKMDLYEYIIFITVFWVFSVASLLITPFVMIYTKNITDANYYQPIFGYILLFSEACSLIKYPHLDLAYSANKFKEISKPAYIEASINIIVSILLIFKFGLIGIVIGTSIAMIYRLIFHIFYTKKIIGRSPIIFVKKIIIFTLFSLIGIIICLLLIPKVKFNASDWIVHGIIYSLIVTLCYFMMSIIFFRKENEYLKKYLKK